MSVTATELSPMTREVLQGAILLAVDALINALPVFPDGTIDLANVRLTYNDASFLIETGIVPGSVQGSLLEPAIVPAPPVDALSVLPVPVLSETQSPLNGIV
jgi:hypothetical protein